MLKKIKRTKVRIGSPFERGDLIYKGILGANIRGIKEKNRRIINKALPACTYLDDDLFVHQLIQKQRFIENKLSALKTVNSKHNSCYPTFIPLVEIGNVIEKSDYYWQISTFKSKCVNCGCSHRVFYDNFKLSNLVCGTCITLIVENTIGADTKNKIKTTYKSFSNKILNDYSAENENYKKFLKNSLPIYEHNKLYHKNLFNKVLKRIKRENQNYQSNKGYKTTLFFNNILKVSSIVNKD